MNEEACNMQVRRIRADGSSEGFAHVLASALSTAPATILVGYHMATRELQADFRENKLGLFWVFLTPLMYIVAFVVVRNGLERQGFATDEGAVPAAVFALAGLIVFQTWFDSAMVQLSAFSKNQSLIKNIGIEPETFFYSGVMRSMMLALPKVLLLAGAIVLMKVDVAGWMSIPGYLVILAAACLSGSIFGYLLSPFGAVMNDIQVAMQSASLALLLGSAVFYDASVFAGSNFHILLVMNPVACLVDEARAFLFGTQNSLNAYAICWAIVFGFLLPFSIVFSRLSRRIVAERL